MEKIRVLGLAVSLGVVALTTALALRAGPSRGVEDAPVAAKAAINLVPAASAAEVEDLPPAGMTAVIEGKKAGLFILERTEATAEVSGGFARVEVTQRYKNPHPARLEAVYAFPLPENAAVTDLYIRVSSRVVQSEVRKREEAKAVYEAAKSSGRVAALLEQERPNVFTQSVANIPPGETVLVHIRYAHELNYEDGRYRFVFPMTIGPRFIPDAGVADEERITPPMLKPGERGGHDIAASVTIRGGLRVTDLRSISHEVEVRRSTAGVGVRLKEFDRVPNKDLILEWGLAAASPEAALSSHREKGEGTLMLLVQPPARPKASEVTPKEMVFVVDTSGSMAGEPIAKVKEAMRRAIKGMNPGDSFQIIRFDQAASSFRPLPVPNTPENVRDGLSYLNGFSGQGGTNMIDGIKAALDFPRDPGRRRIVFFMTDGYIGNEDEILREVRARLGQTRLFSLGVGSSVNRWLLDALAREGRGFVQYVRHDEPSEKAVSKFYRRIRNPLLLDLEVDWGGLPVTDQEPAVLPDLFDGEPLKVLARYAGPSTGTVTVRGTLAGKPYRRALKVRLPKTRAENKVLPVAWARRRVGRLLSSRPGRPEPSVVEEVTALGLSRKLVTPYTSFVAVERELKAGTDLPLTSVLIPNEMPEGVSERGIFSEGATVSIPRLKPGDPVLSVDAPREALAVIADFPFGARKLCAWDEERLKWACRFLVPRSVPDGRYAIRVTCVNADGTRTLMEAEYAVDSKAPQFEVAARRLGGEVVVTAKPRKFVLETRRGRRGDLSVTHDARRVRLLLADGRAVPLKLERHPDRFVWSAKVSARGRAVVEAVDFAGNAWRGEVDLP